MVQRVVHKQMNLPRVLINQSLLVANTPYKSLLIIANHISSPSALTNNYSNVFQPLIIKVVNTSCHCNQYWQSLVGCELVINQWPRFVGHCFLVRFARHPSLAAQASTSLCTSWNRSATPPSWLPSDPRHVGGANGTAGGGASPSRKGRCVRSMAAEARLTWRRLTIGCAMTGSMSMTMGCILY